MIYLFSILGAIDKPDLDHKPAYTIFPDEPVHPTVNFHMPRVTFSRPKNNFIVRRSPNPLINVTVTIMVDDDTRIGAIDYAIDDVFNGNLMIYSIRDKYVEDFNEVADLPPDLPNGTHTITFSQAETIYKSFTFTYVYNSPILNIELTNNKIYTKNDNSKLFEIHGTIRHDDGFGTVRLYYKINQYDKQLCNTYDVTTSDIVFTENVIFPANLEERNGHIIYFWVEDEINQSSTKYNCSFGYKFNAPALKITVLPKKTYYHNKDKFIYIEGKVSDRDGEGTIDIKYGFNSINKFTTYTISISSPFEEYPFSFNINLPDMPYEGTDTIFVWAIDSNDKNSIPFHFDFEYKYNEPVLRILTQNYQVIYRKKDQLFHIDGIVSDDDLSGYVDVFYIIDSLPQVNISRYPCTSGETISHDIILPNDLSEGSHSITISAIDDMGKKSEQVLMFEYRYHDTYLFITTPDNQEFKKNDIFIIQGNILNEDGMGTVNLYYKFGEYDVQLLFKHTITTDTKFNFKREISFPQNLPENRNHKISIWAIDDSNKISQNFTLNFSFSFNAPQLIITTNDNQQFKHNDGKQMIISGNVCDKDGTGNVIVNYNIDGVGEKLLQSFDINSQDYYKFSKPITFPNQISEGKHFLLIYAIDEKGKYSDKTNLTFFYQFSRPTISVTKGPLGTYYKNDKQFINIEGEFSNSSSVKFYYEIDNKGAQVDRIYINNQKFNIDIPINQNMEEKSYVIGIWIIDDTGKGSEKITTEFEFKYNTPVFVIKTESGQELMRNTNKTIKVKGLVSDKDGSGVSYVMYRFDSLEINNLTIVFINSQEQYGIEQNIPIPLTLIEGYHFLHIWCVDETNKSSFIESVSFNYTYHKPFITITKFPSTPLKRNINKTIHAEGYIIHEDGIGSVTIKCFISSEERNSTTILIKNISRHYFIFDIEIPQSLNEGHHDIIFSAEDGSDKKSDSRKIFQYVYNCPILSLNTRNHSYIDPIKKQIKIQGTIRDDDDGSGYLSIKYQVDDEQEQELAYAHINDCNPHPFSKEINFDDSLEFGSHNVEFYAIDDDNKRSEPITLNLILLPKMKNSKKAQLSSSLSCFAKMSINVLLHFRAIR